VNGEDFPTTEELTYLGSTVRHDGGAGSDIKNRLNKARNAFRMLNNAWQSSTSFPGWAIIPVQHRDQAKAGPELCSPHPIVWLKMLEDG